MNYKLEVDLKEIMNIYSKNHKVGNKNGIKRAYHFAEEKHAGVTRGTGEPYINHVLRTARSVAEWGAESEVIMAALLHDAVEDCDVTLDDIEKEFGSIVRDIVDTVTALSDKDFDSTNGTPTKAQKDLLSEAKLQSKMTSKALLVKIADRIDNLNTLSGVKEEKRIPKAEHTKAIIIPMARLAKADYLADILEDLCFKVEHDNMYENINRKYSLLLETNSNACKESLNTLEQIFSANYSNAALSRYRRYIVDLIHNERSCISIYRQISRSATNLKDDWSSLLNKNNIALYDITLIVSDELGEEKPNLHPYDVFFHYFDKVLSSEGFYLVKYCFTTNKDTGYFLLSDEMDNLYRLFVRTELEYLRFLYGSIVDPDSNFSISNVNEIEPRDTYNEMIKVFRRDGSAMDIDKGATVLDFAFYVHTDLGLHFDYALVDESKSKLPKNTRLSEGDLITVVSNEKILPDITWFKHVNTSRAKHNLVKYFQKLGY